MQRKSQQASVRTLQVVRRPRKNKTFNKIINEFKNKGSKHIVSDSIAYNTINDLLVKVENKIQQNDQKSFLFMVLNTCQKFLGNLINLNDPQNQQRQQIPCPELEPGKSKKDPICGFDRMISVKNQMSKRQQESILSDFKGNNFIEIGNNQFKKKIKDSRSKSSERLIPLIKSISNNLINEEQKIEDLLRQKILKQVNINKVNMYFIDNPNSIHLNKGKGEEVQFGGINLLKNSQSRTNGLKALYRSSKNKSTSKFVLSQGYSTDKDASLISHFSKIPEKSPPVVKQVPKFKKGILKVKL